MTKDTKVGLISSIVLFGIIFLGIKAIGGESVANKSANTSIIEETTEETIQTTIQASVTNVSTIKSFYYIVSVSKLNLREKASSSSKILASFTKGALLEKLDEPEGDWVYVRTMDNIKGYVFFKYVEEDSGNTVKETTKATTKATADRDLLEPDELEILTMMQIVFINTATVTYEAGSGMFVVVPIHLEFMDTVQAAADGDPYYLDKWNKVVDDYVKISIEINKKLPGYAFSLNNPLSPERTILYVVDGIVIYNIMDQKDKR